LFLCVSLGLTFWVFFCVSSDHFIPVLLASAVCVGFSFFSTKPRDWLRRTSPKWPILCRVERKTLTHPTMMMMMTVTLEAAIYLLKSLCAYMLVVGLFR